MLQQQQINDLIEAQYHYFESRRPDDAAEVVKYLMEPLYEIGRYPELLDILERTINEVSVLDPSFQVVYARTLLQLGRDDEAQAVLDVTGFQIRDNPQLSAAVLIDQANSLRRLGHIVEAGEIIQRYREAYDIYKDLLSTADNELKRRLLWNNQATCFFGEGTIIQYFLEEPGEAMGSYQAALDLYEKVSDGEGIGLVYKQMGEIHGQKQFEAYYNPGRAAELINRALDEFQKLNLQNRRYEALFQLGRIQRTQLEASLKLFQECLRIAEGLGLLREQAIANLNIADREFDLHKQRIESDPLSMPDYERDISYRRIMATLEESAGTLRLLESDEMSRHALAECCYLLACVWIELRSPTQAMLYLQKGLAASEEPVFRGWFKHDAERRVMIILKMIQIQMQAGNDEESRKLFGQYQADFALLGISYPALDRIGEIIKSLEDRE